MCIFSEFNALFENIVDPDQMTSDETSRSGAKMLACNIPIPQFVHNNSFRMHLDGMKEWKIYIFKIIDTHISFYSRNTHLLPPKPKSSFRHLKRGIQDFHMNNVLVPAYKAANNVVVV